MFSAPLAPLHISQLDHSRTELSADVPWTKVIRIWDTSSAFIGMELCR